MTWKVGLSFHCTSLSGKLHPGAVGIQPQCVCTDMHGVSEPQPGSSVCPCALHPGRNLQKQPKAWPAYVWLEDSIGGRSLSPQTAQALLSRAHGHRPAGQTLLGSDGQMTATGPQAVLISSAPEGALGAPPSGPGGVLPGPTEMF